MAQVPYEVPHSLWNIIELHAPTVELPEIKFIIGEDLVNQSDELFEEIHCLLDIWRSSGSSTQPNPSPCASTILESPLVRDEILFNIKQLINNIDETKNCLLKSFLSDRKNVYNYSKNVPLTKHDQSGRLTPSRPSGSANSTVPDISVYRDNISAFKVDKVVKELRKAFHDEQVMLRGDIEFLQNAIIEEDSHKDGIEKLEREPTMYELKTFAIELEEKVAAVSQPALADIDLKRPSSTRLSSLSPIPPPSPKEVKPRRLGAIPSSSHANRLPKSQTPPRQSSRSSGRPNKDTEITGLKKRPLSSEKVNESPKNSESDVKSLHKLTATAKRPSSDKSYHRNSSVSEPPSSSRRSSAPPAKQPLEHRLLPSKPTLPLESGKRLSWRQRTIKKVDLASVGSPLLTDLKLKSKTTTISTPIDPEQLLIRKPAPRVAFEMQD